MSDKELDESKSVRQFYTGRSVFITGGTGFVGKVLIEKLLRSCNGIDKIYVLTRKKKNMSIDERLKKMWSLPLFDVVKKENPSSFEKLIPVLGDLSLEGLGLLPIERQVLIEKVSIIFHVAASVRFNDDLRTAVFINTRSTRDICILAGNMKKLVALVHVSSTYTQIDKPEVKEILYPPVADWEKTIKIAESVDNELLTILTMKYLDLMPNCYTFTKKLAEQVISDYSSELPCVIARPSIIISSFSEPIPGWLDNFNGPVSMLIGGGKGILRVVDVNQETRSDFIPVDLTTNMMILSAWRRGIITVTKDPSVYVYHFSLGLFRNVSTYSLINMALRITEDIPLENILWHPNITMVQSEIVYYILMLLLHILPALFIDSLLKLSGSKPMSIVRVIYETLKQQKRQFVARLKDEDMIKKWSHLDFSCSYFVKNDWTFHNENTMSLRNYLTPEDMAIFGFPVVLPNSADYFQSALIGAKMYLLKEDMNQLHKAKVHYNRMQRIDIICKILFTVMVLWYIYSYYFSGARGNAAYLDY